MARPLEKDLLGAEDVAELMGVKETMVWRWCREGRLPCLKVGKHWRIRREALEAFLRRSERSTTLVGQLSSFLQVPDNVLAIAQPRDADAVGLRRNTPQARRGMAYISPVEIADERSRTTD